MEQRSENHYSWYLDVEQTFCYKKSRWTKGEDCVALFFIIIYVGYFLLV